MVSSCHGGGCSWRPRAEPSEGRTFIDDVHSLNHDEVKVLAQAVDAAPARTFRATRDFIDKQGRFRRAGFVVRTTLASPADGGDHLIARAVNLVDSVPPIPPPTERLSN